ncbi:MAG: efflux RND transporter permease subunit [Comamonadaceae bacterium]|nr:efflux RND transporter permease subunit [Comamonadaceae bacterium]
MPIYDSRQLSHGAPGQPWNCRQGSSALNWGRSPPGLGEVFHYVLRSDNPKRTLDELRTLHDWVVKPELRKVAGRRRDQLLGRSGAPVPRDRRPGAADQVRADPRTRSATRLQANNANVGGGQVIASGQALLVHGIGRVSNLEQVGNIVVTAHDRRPGAHPRRRRGAHRPRTAARRGLLPGAGRGGHGPRLHAHGGEQPRGDHGAERTPGDGAQGPARGCGARDGLRPHRTGRPGHQDRRAQPGGRGDPGRRHPLPAPRQRARRPAGRRRHPRCRCSSPAWGCGRWGSPPACFRWGRWTSASWSTARWS